MKPTMPNMEASLLGFCNYGPADTGMSAMTEKGALDMAIATLQARNKLFREALEKCAAPFDTGPTTLSMAPHIISTEFQRRMNIAAMALTAGDAT